MTSKTSFNTFEFKENGKRIIEQEFNGSITITGYTENGRYEFKYEEWKNENDK